MVEKVMEELTPFRFVLAIAFEQENGSDLEDFSLEDCQVISLRALKLSSHSAPEVF